MASDGLKWGLGVVAVLVLAVGGEVLWVHHRNAQDQIIPEDKSFVKTDPDYLVYIKREHPNSLKDEKALKGRVVWVAAGDQLVYYPYAGKVDFAHGELLRGAEKLEIKDAFEQKGKQDIKSRIPLGDKQMFLTFAKVNEPGKLYAMPIGFTQAGDLTLFTDDAFYYDDPHQLFNYWGPDVWKAIDAHTAIKGMTEREAQLSLGQPSTPKGDVPGDRTVVYDNGGKPVSVTFVHKKATIIQ